jgi:SAM-dependent methyltransferase
LKALSPISGKKVLELGCAEGFITKEIAKQAAQVVACELSPLAAERTRNVCVGMPVTGIAGDIRTCLPDETFDIILASDVFYYLTAEELTRVAAALANSAADDGRLIMANEWNSSYSQLTSPDQIIQTIMDTTRWRLVEKDVVQNPNYTHTIATFRLVNTESASGELEGEG